MMKKIVNFFKSINWKDIKPHTYVSMVMVVVAVVNYALTAVGQPIIHLSDETVTFWVNTAMTIIFAVYPMWKNNSYTDMAQLADKAMYALRDGKITKEELERFIENIDAPKDFE